MNKKILIAGILVSVMLLIPINSAYSNNDIQIDNNPIIEPNPVNPPNGTFMKKFERENGGWGYCVQQTSDGGYIITGSGGFCVWLIKTDSAGNKEWDRAFDGYPGYCVRQTTDGGYIISGITGPFGDVLLIKTDSRGEQQWNQIFKGTAAASGAYVQQTSDGGYIVTSTKDTNGYDIWLIKTDSNGTMIWDKTFGGTKREHGNYIQLTADGGYIITGETWSFGTSGDVLLIKTDSNGTMIWNKTFNKGVGDKGTCVQQTTDGGYIITGYAGSSVDEWNDVLLLKTDSDGNKEWDKRFREHPHWYGDWGECVQQTTDGGYIIIGYTNSFSTTHSDIWLIKTDSKGNRTWYRTFRGGGHYVQQASDGGYILTGWAYGGYLWLIKTDKEGRPRNKAITNNNLLLRILEKFPLFQRLLDIWRHILV